MISAGLIDEVFDNLQGRISDAVASFGDYVYIGKFVALTFAALVILGFAVKFVPFQWMKSLIGWAASIMVALVTGMIMMFRHERRDTQQLRDKIKELESKDQPKTGWW